jgi:hypothetical protein
VLLAALVGYLTQQHLITGSAPPPRIVGIDLGTTYSAVAVYHTGTGRTQVIAVDDDGGTERLTMPSIVSFECVDEHLYFFYLLLAVTT